MPTTFSTQNRINLMADGENSGTWGSTTNTNWNLIEQITSTALSKSVAGSADVTLTANNGASDESRNAFQAYTGVLTGSINVIAPAQSRSYILYNNTTGSFTLTFKPSGGTGVVLPQGWMGKVWTDGATAFFGENWAGAYHGQCRLTRTSATALKLVCFNGNLIRVNGAWYQIPSAGISANNTSVFVNGSSGQNLATTTLYYVYLFLNAGVLTFDYSTTTHATSTTIGNVGIEIKSGDDTRTLIGMVYTNGSNQFDDSALLRNVASWFNRPSRVASNDQNTQSTASASLAHMSAWDVDMVTWADQTVSIGFIGFTNQTNVSGGTKINAGDGSVTPLSAFSFIGDNPGTAINAGLTLSVNYAPTEGRHQYWVLMSVDGAGTATANGLFSIRGN